MNGQEQIRAVLGGTTGPALLPYLTAGLPHPDQSVGLFVAMAEAGADAFEVGIPYSDPLMDGPVIMAAGEAALAAGATRAVALDIVRQVVERTGKPVLAMTYANPVMQRGWSTYADDVAAAGGSGIIVPDLPFEESEELRAACDARGIGLVQFVSPTTPSERMEKVAAINPAFIYGVADMGVTGERAEGSPHARALSERVRALTDVPLVFGVGISTPEQAAALNGLADGLIIGTAIVRRVLEAADAAAAASSLSEVVTQFKAAMTAGKKSNGHRQRPSS
ncbi:MAG: tryptophan synthase subunit alpha [Acidimicrobiia bacterium]